MKTTITLSLDIASRLKLERLAAKSETFMSTIVEKLIESVEEHPLPVDLAACNPLKDRASEEVEMVS